MKKPIKRILAKEIIIFFSAVTFVGLICLGAIIIDRLRIQKSQRLKVEIDQLTQDVDSIESLFPKAISFEEMIIGELPKKYKIIQSWDDYIVSIDSTKIAEIQIDKLYNLLLALNYPFNGDTNWIPSEVFVENIKNEFRYDWNKKNELNKIYKFLKDKKFINISDEQFVLNLEGYPIPPDEKIFTKFLNLKEEIETIKRNLNINNSKILNGDDLENKALFTFLLLMVIIYPLRFIILSIIWAIRTLKEKPTIEKV